MYVVSLLLAASGHHVFAFNMVLCHLLPMHFRHICQMVFRFHYTYNFRSNTQHRLKRNEKRDVIYNKNDI